MVLGFGPVVRFELITTARRGRYYAARAIYGSVLLFILWGQFAEWERYHPSGVTPEQLRQFSEPAFLAFGQTQLMALLVLLPALVAGVIADEHQRKTLHYLLASRLSSLEIVLGKLAARLIHVGTFVAIGLPVVCLLALYGGLDPLKVFVVYFVTFTAVLALSGLSMLVSVLARRPRDAILATYLLEAVWLLAPPALAPVADALGGALGWVEPVSRQMLVSNPVQFLESLSGGRYRYYFAGELWLQGLFPTMGRDLAAFIEMTAMHLVVGLGLLAIAIIGLRPLRGSSWPGSEPRKGWWSRLSARARAASSHRAAVSLTRNELLWSPFRRRPCGDRPMIWKERYTSLGGGLRWLGSRPVVLVGSVLLGCFLFDVFYPVLAAIVQVGRYPWPEMVAGSIQAATGAIVSLGLLMVATSSAVSLTGEREQDTWISLATTLLTPGEVIVAKQFGAVWSARGIGLGLILTWGTGILLGGVHPLAVLLAAVMTAVAAWLAASVGVFASAVARNSTRALAGTFIPLLVLLGYWPFGISNLLVSPREFDAIRGRVDVLVTNGRYLTPAIVAFLVIIMACYAAISALLTAWSTRTLRTTWGRG